MQIFAAVFVLLRNVTVCQMKELVEENRYLYVWGGGVGDAICPVYQDIIKLHRCENPWKRPGIFPWP